MSAKQVAFLGFLIAATFTFVGVALILTEPALFFQGAAGVLLGLVAIFASCIFGFRGHRLTVEIGEREIIVGGYWTNQIIPFESIVAVKRCTESIAFQLPHKRVYVDYFFFENEQAIELFMKNVAERLRNAKNAEETKDSNGTGHV